MVIETFMYTFGLVLQCDVVHEYLSYSQLLSSKLCILSLQELHGIALHTVQLLLEMCKLLQHLAALCPTRFTLQITERGSSYGNTPAGPFELCSESCCLPHT